MFRRLKARFGGGTTVDTVVHTPVARPGGALEGVVEIVGGEFEQQISYLDLKVVVRAEHEYRGSDGEDRESVGEEQIGGTRASGPFALQPGERRTVPFRLDLPLETPFNVVGGRELPKVAVGVRTELEIAKSSDKGDFDPVRVEPLPAQQRILTAFERVGCVFRGSDVERGRIPGAALNCYQELEFGAPPGLSGRLSEVEVSFVATPHSLEVLIEADRRGGFLTAGGDHVLRLSIAHDAIDTENWEAIVAENLEELAARGGFFG